MGGAMNTTATFLTYSKHEPKNMNYWTLITDWYFNQPNWFSDV